MSDKIINNFTDELAVLLRTIAPEMLAIYNKAEAAAEKEDNEIYIIDKLGEAVSYLTDEIFMGR